MYEFSWVQFLEEMRIGLKNELYPLTSIRAQRRLKYMQEPRLEDSKKLSENFSSQLSFNTVEWSDESIDSKREFPIPCDRLEIIEKEIEYKGRSLLLRGEHMTKEGDIRELFIFSIIDSDQAVVEVRLAIKNSSKGTSASMNIGKSENSSVPGMPLYTQALDFIQHLANQRQKSIKHEVRRSAGEAALGRQVLPMDTWKKTFDPLLMERGYIPKTDTTYEKQYDPQN